MLYQELAQKGYPFPGSRQVVQHAEKVLVRFASIRGACVLSEVGNSSGWGWEVRPIAPRDYCQVIYIPLCAHRTHAYNYLDGRPCYGLCYGT